MKTTEIDSRESEGAFNEFIDQQLDVILEDILNSGDFEDLADRDSDLIVELDDIKPPSFTYGDESEGEGRGQGPGTGAERLRFTIPFERFMELVAQKLRLPSLLKAGKGRIKEVSYDFKTFGTTGVLLDRKRTFRRALRSSIAQGIYRPDKGDYHFLVQRRDRRFKVPERVEKPRYRAVVFYMGDISYSTYGDRIELEKSLVSFIYHWLNYNYGAGNVEHRFFVHDVKAYEVDAEQFFHVSNAGGTEASIAFELIHQIATHEYPVEGTNFYGFYFGDGELFAGDVQRITTLLEEKLSPIFNRVGITEVKGSKISTFVTTLEAEGTASNIYLSRLQSKDQMVAVIKTLFSESPGASDA